ncbi:hypothetical protein M405DRAFT_837648 [Rhizopogon salebrosus TDB-379]|nr:hypothetical protein M405DRAFT_837648 [Rhizopogon salebrosus TDB-379]
MSTNSTELSWGSGFIDSYGTAFGQFIFYMRYFPRDTRKFKLFLTERTGRYYICIDVACCLLLNIADTAWGAYDTLIVFAVEWYVFPRWLPLGLWQICFNYRKLLCKQGVDNHNANLQRALATAILITFDLFFRRLRTRSPEVLFGTKFPRSARTANIRSKSRDYLKELALAEMSLFSCLVMMAILYQFQYGPIGQSYPAAPGALMGKKTSYSIDLVVRFNARKGIRERQQIAGSGVELPTIPAIR